ncbi:uncharacterized protein EV154DRAFT_225364 [Mucor mucedo]|uniref:uncharacterized protein n=1 Tax=Mucor mucedo TaxID=29922 RepID=UPI00221EFD09|nr:uncharacterized protein EV154DRAFT_225364 [Mucor mucedo]KAI7891264.1 hypothetical protein EV154DRAFT_225364 [Mucor mucedo]
MIYYMESNVLVSAEYILTKPNDVQFREAVLNTFSASGMHIEPIQDILVNTLGHFAQNETSEAVFAGFSKNGLDANPLDIRQKRHLAFEESRLTSEEKKRIVPMDLDKLEQRFDSMGGDFSWKSLTGHRRIHVDLDLPFNNNGDTDPLTGFEDSDIKISMAMFGGNIGEGVKELIQQGKIKENPPIWLKGLSVSNAKRLVVNSDGVSKEVKEAVKHKFV